MTLDCSLQGRPALLQRKETHLKYAVEVQIPRATPMMGMLELVMERVVYEDIPFNLAAVKQRVEERKLQRRIQELEDQGLSQMLCSFCARLGNSAAPVRLCWCKQCWTPKKISAISVAIDEGHTLKAYAMASRCLCGSELPSVA